MSVDILQYCVQIYKKKVEELKFTLNLVCNNSYATQVEFMSAVTFSCQRIKLMSCILIEKLAADAKSVFANAYVLSSMESKCRVSTQYYLRCLPPGEKRIMTRLCEAIDYPVDWARCDTCLLPAPPSGWESTIVYSTCVENTLRRCSRGTTLHQFLILLCRTAVQLSACIQATGYDLSMLESELHRVKLCEAYAQWLGDSEPLESGDFSNLARVQRNI